ncbi:MAG: histidine kinase, partial [Rubrivivax sp.]|nr:histidine kinase [Rubrivivax sp.]
DSRDRLLARERELDHANRGLEQFVRMVSHDLREPLNTITQFGRLVDEDHGAAMPAQARHFVRLMNGGAARMRRLLDDVLHYARAQRGLTVDRHPVELDAVLHDALQGLQARIGASGARVQVAPLPVVPGQASLLQLLFQNLLSNALKFVAPGQVPEVEVSASVADGWVEVSVQDQGIGIAEADQARVFEPFQRVHLRRDYDGTGLGLALARQIAQAHGGDIRLRSAPGKGSCFTVRLPAG